MEHTTEAEPVVAPPEPSASDAIVDAWFVETFHNLALPTELQNRLAAAHLVLKARLARKES